MTAVKKYDVGHPIMNWVNWVQVIVRDRSQVDSGFNMTPSGACVQRSDARVAAAERRRRRDAMSRTRGHASREIQPRCTASSPFATSPPPPAESLPPSRGRVVLQGSFHFWFGKSAGETLWRTGGTAGNGVRRGLASARCSHESYAEGTC